VFSILNRGKKSITLELRSEEGREIVCRLISQCDVLLENFTPGVMKRLGLGYEEMSRLNPRLIYASLSGFGQDGPYASRPAFDMVAQAMGGLMSVTGFPDKPPTKCGPAIADLVGGTNTVIAILAALQNRHKTGRGQSIDISLQDSIWLLTAVEALAAYGLTGKSPGRIGNMHPGIVPWNVYQARDGYVVICTVTIGQWQKLAETIGRSDLISDPEQCTMVVRLSRREELDAIVADWVKRYSVAEILQILDKAELPCAPILDTGQIVNDPHMKYRQMTVEVEQLLSGPLKMPGTVFKMSQTPGDPYNPAPFLGEHNSEVYSELLGYSEEKINELMARGII
jgi:crotonobetainyl-CoA:carnitine CoA-transferase CaiB-like acyl-CoA transferase